VARTPSTTGQLRARVEAALAARLSPERTRRATLLERLTVVRLSWEQVVRLLQCELWRRDVEHLESRDR
jgi:hypothetical protein